MAEVENDCFPSKRIRLSPERESNILGTSTEQVKDKQESVIDEETFLSDSSVFQTSNNDALVSREQDGGDTDFSKHDQFEGDDFPSCFSVEDNIDNSEEHHYQPIAGPMGWVQKQMNLGINPREILSYMVPHAKVPSDLQDDHITLWKIIIDLLTAPTPRRKLDHVNTIDDVVNLIHRSKNIVVLTGAGVSVSCGIPDFRSRDGIYARLSEEYPDLPDPQAMFDITYFNQNPYPFFKFAKEIYPGQFKPSLSHQFIYQIENHDSLLRNYSQNIDTLEQIAGITRVIQCHGSFSTASCTKCKYQVSSADIKEDIFNQRIPVCSRCNQTEGTLAIMKPDIVFFGENLPSDFYHHLEDDSEKADLLIVIGSSLKVRPVALIPSRIAVDVPQILINREPLRHMTFDVELLGDCDVIVAELCKRLGGTWADILDGSEVCPVDKSLYPTPHPEDAPPSPVPTSSCSGRSFSVKLKNHEEEPSEECSEQQQKSSVTCNTQSSTSLEQEQITQQKHLPVDSPSAHTSEIGSDIANTSEQWLANPSSSSPQDEHSVSQESVGVQSVGQDTSCVSTDDNQREGTMTPSESALATEHPSNQESTSNCTSEDLSTFIYHPPSRYIFYGAEITNSPIHSPFASPLLLSDDCNSDGCSDNGSLSRDEFDSTNLEGNGYSSSGDGSEGYGSGVMSNTDYSSYDLTLITGALGDYHCVSEENSVMSAIDLVGEGSSDHTNNDLNVNNMLSTSDVPETAPLDKGCREGVELCLSDADYFTSTKEGDSTIIGHLDNI